MLTETVLFVFTGMVAGEDETASLLHNLLAIVNVQAM